MREYLKKHIAGARHHMRVLQQVAQPQNEARPVSAPPTVVVPFPPITQSFQESSVTMGHGSRCKQAMFHCVTSVIQDSRHRLCDSQPSVKTLSGC